jgi:hypothetical protein
MKKIILHVHVQSRVSCICTACYNGHLEVVKYLCEQGGKELLMLTDKVSHKTVLLSLSLFSFLMCGIC